VNVPKTILLNGSLAESILNFRGPLIAEMVARGHRVHVSSPDVPESIANAVISLGATPHSVPLQRAGFGLYSDVRYCRALWRLMAEVKPDLVVGYTIKPNIWGSMVAHARGIPSAAMVTGLGFAFIAENGVKRALVQRLARWLYRMATSANSRVIFQNPDDLEDFVAAGCLSNRQKARLVNGSGVDLAHFRVAPLPAQPVFLLIARLLKTKGIQEFVDATNVVRQSHSAAKFRLAGPMDASPDGVTEAKLAEWIEAGIEYLGPLSDVRPAIADANIYVLPSYREGTPRTVLEAMAMGRAIITTDVPGCRETTVDGANGFLVPVRRSDELAAAMIKLADSPALRATMGIESRRIAEQKYDVNRVNEALLAHLEL
jgi:glycosyltransferase involved in cell wall biosynthesis